MLTNLNVDEDAKQELTTEQRLQLSSLGRHSESLSEKDGTAPDEHHGTKMASGLISDDDDDMADLAAKISPIILDYGSYSIKTGLSFGNNIHGPQSLVRTIIGHKKPSLQQRLSKKLSKSNFDFSGITSFFNKAKSKVDIMHGNDNDDVVDEAPVTDEIVYNVTTQASSSNSSSSSNNTNTNINGSTRATANIITNKNKNKSKNEIESKTNDNNNNNSNNNNNNLHKESSSKLIEMKTPEAYMFGDSVIAKLPDPRMSTFDEIMDHESILHYGHITNWKNIELLYDHIFDNEINIGNYSHDTLADHPQFHLQSITTLNEYETLVKMCDSQPDIKVHSKGKIFNEKNSNSSSDILVSPPATTTSTSKAGGKDSGKDSSKTPKTAKHMKNGKRKRRKSSKKHLLNGNDNHETIRQACGIGEPSGQTHKICEILFEKFGIPAFYTLYSEYCALYGAGIVSGVVVDIGYDSTRILSVYNNGLAGYNDFTMRNASNYKYMPYELLDVGGESMTKHLMQSINRQTQSNYLKALSPSSHSSSNIAKTYDYYTFEQLKLLGLKSFKFDYTTNNKKGGRSRRSLLKFNNNGGKGNNNVNNNNNNGNGNGINNVNSKKPVFYVAYDYKNELKRAFSPRTQNNSGKISPSSGISNNFGKLSKFTLPDGKTIVCDLKKESFEMGEVLFQPFMAKSSGSSIIEKIVNVAQMWYCDDNKNGILTNGFNLYDHLVLTGAGSMIDGITERIERDLKLKQQRQAQIDQRIGLSQQYSEPQHTPPLSDKRILPTQSNVTITAKTHRKNCAWLGASAYIDAVLGDINSGKWFDKNMYQEYGPKGVYRVCSL